MTRCPHQLSTTVKPQKTALYQERERAPSSILAFLFSHSGVIEPSLELKAESCLNNYVS